MFLIAKIRVSSINLYNPESKLTNCNTEYLQIKTQDGVSPAEGNTVQSSDK